MIHFKSITMRLDTMLRHARTALLAVLTLLPLGAHAVETQCAKVKIEIQQELTMERQGFDAMMGN